MTLLQVKNLNISYNSKKIVQNVCFEIPRDSIVGLTGKSGSGKTLIGYALTRIQPPKIKIDAEKMVLTALDDLPIDLNIEYKNARGYRIAYIFQEPSAALNPIQKCGLQVQEILGSFSAVIELFRKLLFNEPVRIFNSYPHQLSGGEKQRIAIAMAIALNPDLIVADEPTTSLDPETANEILSLLDSLRKENKCSLLLITHDLNLLKKYTNSIYTLEKGILTKTETLEIKRNPQLNKGIPIDKDRYIKIQNLQLPYGVKDISLNLYLDEITGLIGPSGSGKSSLAKALTGLIKTYSGSIASFPESLNIQLIQQDSSTTLNPKIKIGKSIQQVLKLKNKMDISVDYFLKLVNLPFQYVDKYPYQLSGGERQRVAIARALAAGPHYLICDESFSAQDFEGQSQILKLILELKEKLKIGVLIISHDHEQINSICSRTISLKNGKILEDYATF